MLPLDDITDLIPQKRPFVFVDRLLASDDERTVSSFLIRLGALFVHEGVFQEAGLLENMAQTAALRAGFAAREKHTAPAVGYIGAVQNMEISELPRAGQEIRTEVSVKEEIFNVTVLSGKVWLEDRLIAACEMKVFSS